MFDDTENITTMNIIPEKIETVNRIFNDKEDILKSITNLNSAKVNKLKTEIKNKVDILNSYVDNVTDLKTEIKNLKQQKYALTHELNDTKSDMERLQKMFPMETSKLKDNINLQNILYPTDANNSSFVNKYFTSFFVKIGQAAKVLHEKLRRFED